MLRIDIAKAKSGMRLALPVQNPQEPARTLLKVGFELTDSTIARLKQQQIRSVWVKYPGLDFLERFIDAETVQRQAELVGQMRSTFEALQNQAAAKINYDTYTQTLRSLIEHLAGHPQSMIFLGDLADTDDELMRHSASVTYLALLIGMKLESYLVKERKHVNPARAKEVANLGLGAMLHDVGVTQLDEQTRLRHEREGDESDPAWQEHAAIGYQMVRGSVDPSAATIVLNHHQHWDGSGYAGGEFPSLSGAAIHVFARITAVADQFDRLRNPPHMPAQPIGWALKAMLQPALAARFDPQALRALLAVTPPYPPGSIVRLNDERYAVSIDHVPETPCRPRVQILPSPDLTDEALGEVIDLNDRPDLYVIEHEGQPVADCEFDPAEVGGTLDKHFAWA